MYEACRTAVGASVRGEIVGKVGGCECFYEAGSIAFAVNRGHDVGDSTRGRQSPGRSCRVDSEGVRIRFENVGELLDLGGGCVLTQQSRPPRYGAWGEVGFGRDAEYCACACLG